jgi:hypothetical protein
MLSFEPIEPRVSFVFIPLGSQDTRNPFKGLKGRIVRQDIVRKSSKFIPGYGVGVLEKSVQRSKCTEISANFLFNRISMSLGMES